MTDQDKAATAVEGRGAEEPDARFGYESLAQVGPPECREPVRFYQRMARPSPPPPLIRRRDLGEAALHTMMAGAALVRAPEAWPGFCQRITRLRYSRLVRGLAPFRDGLRAVMGNMADAEVERHFKDWWDCQHRRRMMLVREYVGGGPVRFTLTGREHLDAAAASGRGLILWASPLAAQTLAGKRGLFEAGIRAYQVAAVHHGFWDTYSKFGDRFLNRLLTRAEDRYLAGRLAFERDDAGMLIRRVMRTLKTGAAVILTNNLYAGRSFVEMPFGRAGFVSMPTTPIALALQGRVPLLSCATIERQALSHYEIRIGPDLTADESAPGGTGGGAKDQAVVARVALNARDALLASVLDAPDQFVSWPTLARSVLGGAG